jgi:hypothetical protein
MDKAQEKEIEAICLRLKMVQSSIESIKNELTKLRSAHTELRGLIQAFADRNGIKRGDIEQRFGVTIGHKPKKYRVLNQKISVDSRRKRATFRFTYKGTRYRLAYKLAPYIPKNCEFECWTVARGFVKKVVELCGTDDVAVPAKSMAKRIRERQIPTNARTAGSG